MVHRELLDQRPPRACIPEMLGASLRRTREEPVVEVNVHDYVVVGGFEQGFVPPAVDMCVELVEDDECGRTISADNVVCFFIVSFQNCVIRFTEPLHLQQKLRNQRQNAIPCHVIHNSLKFLTCEGSLSNSIPIKELLLEYLAAMISIACRLNSTFSGSVQ